MIRNVISSMIIICTSAKAQMPVDVMESTMKVAGFGEETFYLAFAEGDQIIFNFEETNQKDLKELEIIEWPNSTKFSDFKTSKVVNKRIDVHHTSVYKFRFANSAIGGRICKIVIQRIPANASSVGFDTNIYWRTISDTTYTPVEERYLVSSDTTITNVADKVTKISSQSALNGDSNLAVVDIDLPEGTVAWSYYIGVGEEGRKAYDAAAEKFLTTASKAASKIEGYGTMAALAIYGLNLFAQVQGRDNVKYWLLPDWNNVLLFQSRQGFQTYKIGDVITDASKMTYPIRGKVYLGLLNDNIVEPIEVIVKVSSVQIKESWGIRNVTKIHVTQRTEPFFK